MSERVLRAHYFIRIPNVGDRINPLLLGALAGCHVERISDLRHPHVLGVGSMMAAAAPNSHVWGTGVMHPDLGLGQPDPHNIFALRGKQSLSCLRAAGIDVKDVPLGDPGFLAPGLLGIEAAKTPRYRVGLSAHYVDRDHPIVRRMLLEQGVLDLNVHDDPITFLNKMAQCEVVLSSSLHGLVFGEALGLPTLWLKAGDDIAGAGFKFHDWFTTTRRPQASPRVLSAGDTASALSSLAEPRESLISASALLDAFPADRLDHLLAPVSKSGIQVRRETERPVPVFLISFNRGEMLKRTINAVRRLSRATEIVVHDNGSSDGETLRILGDLEREGVRVFRRAAISSADELNQVDASVQAYFADWLEPGRYVVSDCDVDMSIADPRALEVYDELLNRFRRIDCVGPMLRIRDVPRTYPLFNHVMNRHIEQFWRQAPQLVDTSVGQVAVLEAQIDTTFAMHRAGEPFRRQKAGLRVYEPFEARHLDWYPGEDGGETYFTTSNALVSHWNNEIEHQRYLRAPLEYSHYQAVRMSESGSLEVYTEQLGDVGPA